MCSDLGVCSHGTAGTCWCNLQSLLRASPCDQTPELRYLLVLVFFSSCTLKDIKEIILIKSKTLVSMCYWLGVVWS